MSEVLDALRTPEFQIGLRVGLVFLVAAVVVLAPIRRRIGRPVPAGGLFVAAAAAAAMADARTLPGGLAIGLIVMAILGAVDDIFSAPPPLVPLLAAPGAVLIATHAGLPHDGWATGGALAVAMAGGVLWARFDRRYGSHGMTLSLATITVVGIYLTVPDTEEALVLAGVALATFAMGWPLGIASAGSAGSLALAGVVGWTVATGGHTRPSAIIGSLACLGVVAAEPVAATALKRSRLPDAFGWAGRGTVSVAAVHAGLVLAASRVVGLRRGAPEAVILATVELVAASALLCGLAKWRGQRRLPSARQ